MERLDCLTLDRILVPLSLDDNEERRAGPPIADHSVKIVSSIDAGDRLMHRNVQVVNSLRG